MSSVRYIRYFVVLVLAAGGGCSELKDDLPPPVSPGVVAHPAGWLDSTSADFHGRAIRNAGWDMRSCKDCHGATYAGGISSQSCRTCHTGDTGPENCITCHGSANPAPPVDLDGNTSATAHGVGAHQRHLLGGGATSSRTMPCSDCHTVPPAVYTAGHVDSPSPAEVFFRGSLAGADPSDVVAPAYDPGSLQCSNTFCHGNWNLRRSASSHQSEYTDSVMSGGNHAALWTGGPAEIACGTCHGLPPAGHVAATLATCGTCHTNTNGVAMVNASGLVTDKVSHLNGRVNVFASERNF